MPRPGSRALVGQRRRHSSIVVPPPPPVAPTQIYGWNIPASGATAASILDPPILSGAVVKADPRGTTGIPSSQVLTVVNGDYHTTAANQVIHNLWVKGIFYVDHPGCVVYFCWADAFLCQINTTPRYMHCKGNGGWDRRTGPLGQVWYWTGSGDRTLAQYRAYRCEVLGACDGCKTQGGCWHYNCWFHDNWYSTDSTQSSGDTHNDGMQTQCGDDNRLVGCFMQSWTFSPDLYGEKLDANGVGPHVAARDATRDWDSGTSFPGGIGTYHGKQTSSWLTNTPATWVAVSNSLVADNVMEGLTTKYIHFAESFVPLGSGNKVQNNVCDTQNRDYPQWLALVDHNDPRFTISGNKRPDGTAIT